MSQRALKPQTLLAEGLALTWPRAMNSGAEPAAWSGALLMSRGRTGQDMTKRYSSCRSLQGLADSLRSLDTCVLFSSSVWP